MLVCIRGAVLINFARSDHDHKCAGARVLLNYVMRMRMRTRVAVAGRGQSGRGGYSTLELSHVS